MKLYKYNNNRLKYESVNLPIIFLKFAIGFLSIFLFLGLTNLPKEPEYFTETEKILIINELNEYS